MSSGQKQQTEALSRIELPATGERFVTQNMGEHIQVAYEHLHRYLLAQECCRGKSVLDIASGEGYGSNILAQSAKNVVGVDISNDAILFARQKYKRANLRFTKGDCTRIPMGKHSVDVVVSFETIEHILQQEAFIVEIRRVLRPGGLLIISSPDKHEYSDRSGYTNPFHVAELYRSDFLRLLKRHFKNCRSLQQRLVAGSYIAADPDNQQGVCYGTHRGNLLGGTFNEGVHEGLYSVAICSDEKLPDILAGIFENRAESARIWHAFEELDNVRADMETLRGYLEDERRRIRECEAEKLRAQTHYQELALRYDHVESQLRKQHEDSTQQILELQSRARELDEEAVARGEWGKRLDGEIEALRNIVAEQRSTIEQLEKQSAEKALSADLVAATEAAKDQQASITTHQLQSQQEQLQTANAQLAREAEALGKRVAELERDLLSSQENALRYEERLSQLQQEITNREQALRLLQENCNELLNDRQEQQLKHESLCDNQRCNSQELARLLAANSELQENLRTLAADHTSTLTQLSSLEAEGSRLDELNQRSIQANEELAGKLDLLTQEKNKLHENHGELSSKLLVVKREKDLLITAVQSLETDKSVLLGKQDQQLSDNNKLSLELENLKLESSRLLANQETLLTQLKALEQKSSALEEARDLATSVANESQNLLEQFFQKLSTTLETARAEITCLNEIKVVHITESEPSEPSQSPMQTELSTLKNQSETILNQMESDQKSTYEQLKQATVAIRSLSQEKEALQALVGRTSADWVEAEKQATDAQEQLWQILTEAEQKLHWAASLDKDLCAMRKAVGERDELIEKQKAQYSELEVRLKEALAREEQVLAREQQAQLREEQTQAKILQLAAAETQTQAEMLHRQRETEAKGASALQQLEKRLTDLSLEANASAQELAHIKASLAWKVSAPLRLFSKDFSEKKTT